MLRTPSDIRRRRDLADAASGFVRTPVVLYICAPDGGAAALPTLRMYALARDWLIADEITDSYSIASALAGRPGWRAVNSAIETGRARGIVTDARSACGHYPEEHDRVNAWLADHMAFISVVPASRAASSGCRGCASATTG
jgi:hypothetical protein